MSKTLVMGASGNLGSYFMKGIGAGAIPTFNKRPVEGGVKFDLASDKPRVLDSVSDIDCAVLLLSFCHFDDCKRDRDYAWNVNVDKTWELISYLREREIKVVFASTESVYDGRDGGMYTEEEPTSPNTVYGETKAEIERRMMETAPDRDLIVRFCKVFTSSKADNSLFAQWYRALKDPDVEILCADDQYTCPTHVDDVVSGVKTLIELKKTGIYNVCHSKRYKRLPLLQEFATAIGIENVNCREVSSSHFDFFDNRGTDTSLSNEKIVREAGVEFRPFSAVFADYV